MNICVGESIFVFGVYLHFMVCYLLDFLSMENLCSTCTGKNERTTVGNYDIAVLAMYRYNEGGRECHPRGMYPVADTKANSVLPAKNIALLEQLLLLY